MPESTDFVGDCKNRSPFLEATIRRIQARLQLIAGISHLLRIITRKMRVHMSFQFLKNVLLLAAFCVLAGSATAQDVNAVTAKGKKGIVSFL